MAFMKRPVKRFAVATGSRCRWFDDIHAAEDHARLCTSRDGKEREIIDYGKSWAIEYEDWPDSSPHLCAVVRKDANERTWTDVCSMPGEMTLL